MKYITASFGTSMVAVFIGFSFWTWIEVATAHDMDLNKWVIVAGALALLYASDFYIRRHGLEFGKQFCGFSRNKQIALYLAAAGIIVVTLIAFFMVGAAYRAMFHPPRI
jgi:hypothetical protein